MTLYPANLLEVLEFNKILENASQWCLGSRASKQILDLKPLTDQHNIQSSLLRVKQCVDLIGVGSDLPLTSYQDLDDSLRWLEKDQSIIEKDAAIEVRNQCRQMSDLLAFFSGDRKLEYTELARILPNDDTCAALLKELEKIFDDEGEIRDSASSDLRQIRKQISSKKSAIDHAFNKALARYRQVGYLADTLESYRNNRRVLAVLAEAKRKVKGLIHDESSTGRTVFVEPEESILLTNEWFELKNDERREISRILLQLSERLRIEHEYLVEQQDALTLLDSIRARAKQAIALNASLPKVGLELDTSLEDARHPLLLLKHAGDQEVVIPFDLVIDNTNRIVVISGPNAGGKTITLKATGLLQVMVQSGLLPPVSSDSTFRIYRNFFADIGDQQSIEQDLSTYTSHLHNMRSFTESADADSLMLIDELGSGTEPGIGGAIAEAVLMRLLKNQARGVITTHYANLKILASETPGLVNGSMEFDKKELQPTYKFKLGVPGSSYAFEMAKRSGLDSQIIRLAKKKLGRQEGKLEDLLVNLQQDKSKVEAKYQDLLAREKDLDRLTKSYERLNSQLEVRRKKLKLDEKTFRLQEKIRENKSLEKLVREIREKENLNEAKRMASAARKERDELIKEVNELNDSVVRKEKLNSDRKIIVGDFVRMKLGGMSGVVEEIRKGKATIRTGNMTLQAPVKELVLTQEPLELSPNRSVQTDLQSVSRAYHKLDIRGLRKAEASLRIEQFIDQALVTNLTSVEVIHGKGNGVLRNVVREKLKEYDQDFNITHPAPEFGGEGVSIVRLS